MCLIQNIRTFRHDHRSIIVSHLVHSIDKNKIRSLDTFTSRKQKIHTQHHVQINLFVDLILSLIYYFPEYKPHWNIRKRRIYSSKSSSLPQVSRIRPSGKVQHGRPCEIYDCFLFFVPSVNSPWTLSTSPYSSPCTPLSASVENLHFTNVLNPSVFHPFFFSRISNSPSQSSCLAYLTAHQLDVKIPSLMSTEQQDGLRIPLPSLPIIAHMRGKWVH